MLFSPELLRLASLLDGLLDKPFALSSFFLVGLEKTFQLCRLSDPLGGRHGILTFPLK